MGGAPDRDSEYFFTNDEGILVVVPEYDFEEGKEGYDFDRYDVTLKNGVFTFHYHNGDVDFVKS